MLFSLDTLPGWVRALGILPITALAYLPLHLNMRTVRKIRCSQLGCTKRAKFVNRRTRQTDLLVDIVGKTEATKIWRDYKALEIRSLYCCPSGHTTIETTYEEVGRKPEALWKNVDVRKSHPVEDP